MKVNGKQVEFNSGQTISQYLVSLKINPGTVAIEWNGEILVREKWSETTLQENDKLEIIKFESMLGTFQTNPATRSEFLSLING